MPEFEKPAAEAKDENSAAVRLLVEKSAVDISEFGLDLVGFGIEHSVSVAVGRL